MRRQPNLTSRSVAAKTFRAGSRRSGHLAFAAKPLQRERGCTFIGKQPGAGDVDTAARSAQHHNACRGVGASEQRAGNIAGQDFFRGCPFAHPSSARMPP